MAAAITGLIAVTKITMLCVKLPVPAGNLFVLMKSLFKTFAGVLMSSAKIIYD